MSVGVLPKGLFFVSWRDCYTFYITLKGRYKSSGSTPRTVFFALWEYSQKAYFLSVGVIVIHFILLYRADIKVLGVLPKPLFLLSGSTPKRLIFCQWEYSHKSGTVLLGVLPKKLFLYTGSDLDMIYNLDILLPLDTLGALQVLLFLVSGSNCGRLIMSRSLPVYKNSFFGSTPGITIPILREYILPLTKNKPSGSTPRN